MNRPRNALALVAASALLLAGCAGVADPENAADGIRVVASTNVYGALAEDIGGHRVDVVSIIASTSQDPHSYEATARDRLAVQNADLVIENGGGYDQFMVQLREGGSASLITAVEFAPDVPREAGDDDAHMHGDEGDHDADGHDDDHAGHEHIAGFNEHVWFDVHTMIHVAAAIADELSHLDPAGADGYEAAAQRLIDDLEAVEQEIDELAHELAGTGVFLTEPLPGYLAAQLGLVDLAPSGFASAVEEGSDVAPATLLAALAVIESGDVSVVLSNAQTGGPETDRIEAAASDAGIPVVGFTELLGDGSSYAEWMRDAISDLTDALRT